MNTPNAPGLLTLDSIAERLKVKRSTVRRWAHDGHIPSVRLSARVIRYDPVAIELALAAFASGTAKAGVK